MHLQTPTSELGSKQSMENEILRVPHVFLRHSLVAKPLAG